MAGWTNRGKFRMLGSFFRAESTPTYFYVALFTNANVPSADTNVVSDLVQIAAGDGYASGGYQVSRNSTDFDVLTEDDANDRALVQLKDITWTASGGPIPISGDGARWACLTDDNGTPASRDIIGFWNLVSDRVVSSGQDLTLQNCELRLTE